MKILVFANFAGSSKHGMVYGHYLLAKEWAKLGHHVTIVTASFSHTRFKNPTIGCFLYKREFVSGVEYIWLKMPSYCPGGKLGRVANIVFFSVASIFFALLLKPRDIVISSSHHALSIFAAKLHSVLHRAKLIFEVRDLWPLSLIDVGGVSVRHPFIRLLQFAEDYAYKNSDRVVSVVPHALPYMSAHGLEKKKFLYVPNGIDFDKTSGEAEFLPPYLEEKVRELNSGAQFVICYAGNFGDANEIGTLINALPLCESKDVSLLLVGKGPSLEKLKDQVQQLNLNERVIFQEPIDKSKVSLLLSYVDAGYVGLKDKPIFKYGISPTKVNDYFKAKLPILYAINAVDEAVTDSGAVVKCEAESSASIAKGIDFLMSMDKEDRKKVGIKGYEWALKNRSYSYLAREFIRFS